MLDMIRKQLTIQKEDTFGVALVVGLAGAFGIALLQVIYYFAPEAAAEYIPVSVILAGLLLGIFSAVLMSVQLSLYFRVTVSMGGVRKYFYWAFLATSLLQIFLAYAVMLLVYVVDRMINKALYPEMQVSVNIWPYLWKWGIPAILLIVLGGVFVGALLMRYGKYATAVVWVLWMALCLGIPRVMSAVTDAPESILGKSGRLLMDVAKAVPGVMWGAGFLILCAVSVMGSYVILRKQQV